MLLTSSTNYIDSHSAIVTLGFWGDYLSHKLQC